MSKYLHSPAGAERSLSGVRVSPPASLAPARYRTAAEDHSLRARAGFTLVEILVVVAIIVILGAIVVPSLGSMGAFTTEPLKNTTRELYSLLKAAQVYATTYRLDCAVAYVPNPAGSISDSVFNNKPVDTFVASAMFRSFSSTDPLAKRYPVLHDYGYFVPLASDNGEWREFPDNVVMYLQDPSVAYAGVNFYSERGLTPVIKVIYDLDRLLNMIDSLRRLNPNIVVDELIQEIDENLVTELPAHRFSASGRLINNSERQRFTLDIAPSPESPPEERLVDPEGQTTDLVTHQIELFQATGRIRIAS